MSAVKHRSVSSAIGPTSEKELGRSVPPVRITSTAVPARSAAMLRALVTTVKFAHRDLRNGELLRQILDRYAAILDQFYDGPPALLGQQPPFSLSNSTARVFIRSSVSRRIGSGAEPEQQSGSRIAMPPWRLHCCF